MSEKHEIAAKLSLDDEASEALHKVKEGFEGVREKVHEVGHEMVGMAKQAAAVAIGFQLDGAIESVKEFGHELVEGAVHLENQKKELAGLIALNEKGESSFEELSEKAGELNEKLEMVAIQTGTSKETMVDAFEEISARSTKSADEVTDMVTKMSEAARVLPGGMATLTQGWKDLETGVIRARSPIVQLIRQTGVAQGSARDVAKALTDMVQHGDQKRAFELGEEAINRMSERAKKLPLTFDQLVESAKNVREMFFEAAGTPIIGAIGPEFEKFRQYLIANRAEIEHLAHTLGVRVGDWVKAAAEKLEVAFQYLNTHADEIMNAIESGAQSLEDAIKFVVDHKDLLLAIFATYKGGQLAGGIAGALPGAGAMAGKAVGSLMAQTGMSAGNAVLATGALAVVDVAVLSELEKQTEKLSKESGFSTGDTVGYTLGGMLGMTATLAEASDNMANFRAEVKAMNDPSRQSAEALRETYRQMQKFGDAMLNGGASDAIRAEIQQMEQEAANKAAAAEELVAMNKQLELTAVASYDSTFVGPQLELSKRFQLVFNTMADDNEKAALDAARKILEGNDVLVEAIGGTGSSVEEALKKLKEAHSGAGNAGSKLPAINFGPTTFNIKQDFRNEDPDRIAVVFRRDVARQGASRVAAKTGVPYGV